MAPPIVVNGDRIRVRLDVGHISPRGLLLSADLTTHGSDGPQLADLGAIHVRSGRETFSASVSDCPCRLTDLTLAAARINPAGVTPVTGELTLLGIDVHRSTGWVALPGIRSESQWRQAIGGTADPNAAPKPGADGLDWSFDVTDRTTADLVVNDHPAMLPAVVTGDLVGAKFAAGLDDNPIAIAPIAVTAALPGAPNGGTLVDRAFAERAAAGVFSGQATQQVWAAAGDGAASTAGLKRAGIAIITAGSATEQAARYERQGPGLASTTFLTDAAAAAILAAAAALAGLVTSGRRRRFEYAALQATGATRQSQFTGLLLEQLAVLIFGAVVGVASGLGAGLIAVRSVPQFVDQPVAIKLTYGLHVRDLLLAVGSGVLVLVITAIVSSYLLITGAGPEQLREAQQ